MYEFISLKILISFRIFILCHLSDFRSFPLLSPHVPSVFPPLLWGYNGTFRANAVLSISLSHLAFLGSSDSIVSIDLSSYLLIVSSVYIFL